MITVPDYQAPRDGFTASRGADAFGTSAPNLMALVGLAKRIAVVDEGRRPWRIGDDIQSTSNTSKPDHCNVIGGCYGYSLV